MFGALIKSIIITAAAVCLPAMYAYAQEHIFYTNWGASPSEVEAWHSPAEPESKNYRNDDATLNYKIELFDKQGFAIYSFKNDKLIESVVFITRTAAYDDNGQPIYADFVQNVENAVVNQLQAPKRIDIPLVPGAESGAVKLLNNDTYALLTYYASAPEEFEDLNIFTLWVYFYDANNSPYVDINKVKSAFDEF